MVQNSMITGSTKIKLNPCHSSIIAGATHLTPYTRVIMESTSCATNVSITNAVMDLPTLRQFVLATG